MLVIRLSRHGRKNLAVYRVVLSEHTKPVKYGYKEVL
jgi:ribosomal protein S16